jgi:hypothetical protein
MATLTPSAKQQFFDANGNPLAGGKLYTYAAGTTTPLVTYTNSDGITANTNPIILDSRGEANIWLGSAAYKFKLTTSTDVELWTVDNVSSYNYDVLSTLANSGGSSLIGFIQSGVNASATTVQSKLREVVSVKDFGAVGDGVTDDTVAIQTAINYAATRALVGGTVYLPPGSYKTSSTIYTYGAGGVGQVALVGAGVFSTRFIPSGDFTVLNLVTSYMESGGFSIEWPVTAAASIPATRIGVEVAGANYQFSYATLKNVTVQYAYRGFVLNDWTGQTYGTAYLCTLQQLTAFRCADWGFYLNSKTGSTTLRMIHCYARGDNSSGGAQYGKGVFVSNFNDIYTEQLAVDQCLNSWVEFVNYNVAVLNGTAFEACKISTTGATAVYLNGSQTVVNGVKDISCSYDTGGSARVIFAGSTCTLALSGYNEQSSTVAGGTTKYRIAFNALGTQIAISDRTIVPSQVLDNGWFANVVYEGRRLSSVGNAPNYGTWLRGDNVLNGSPSVGAPKGWVCTVAGTPGTWVSEGNL